MEPKPVRIICQVNTLDVNAGPDYKIKKRRYKRNGKTFYRKYKAYTGKLTYALQVSLRVPNREKTYLSICLQDQQGRLWMVTSVVSYNECSYIVLRSYQAGFVSKRLEVSVSDFTLMTEIIPIKVPEEATREIDLFSSCIDLP